MFYGEWGVTREFVLLLWVSGFVTFLRIFLKSDKKPSLSHIYLTLSKDKYIFEIISLILFENCNKTVDYRIC